MRGVGCRARLPSVVLTETPTELSRPSALNFPGKFGPFEAGSNFWAAGCDNQGVSFATLRLFSAERAESGERRVLVAEPLPSDDGGWSEGLAVARGVTSVERPIESVDLLPTTAIVATTTTPPSNRDPSWIGGQGRRPAGRQRTRCRWLVPVDLSQRRCRVLGGRAFGSLGQPRGEDAVEIEIADHAGRSAGICSRRIGVDRRPQRVARAVEPRLDGAHGDAKRRRDLRDRTGPRST